VEGTAGHDVAEEVAADAATAEEHHGEHRLHRRRHFDNLDSPSAGVMNWMGHGRRTSAGRESAKNRRAGNPPPAAVCSCGVLALTELVSLVGGPIECAVLSQPPLEAWDHAVSLRCWEAQAYRIPNGLGTRHDPKNHDPSPALGTINRA
jgi:hypothetical protein